MDTARATHPSPFGSVFSGPALSPSHGKAAAGGEKDPPLFHLVASGAASERVPRGPIDALAPRPASRRQPWAPSAPLRLHDVRPGDVCFVFAPGWDKDPIHRLISTVQRLHTGAFWPLPSLSAAGASANVVHTSIVVDVNCDLGELTLAQSGPPAGLHLYVQGWQEPSGAPSNVDPRCQYLFYRLKDPAEGMEMSRIALSWVSTQAGYSNATAALSGLLPNRPHAPSRRDLARLGDLADAGSAAVWPSEPMICSQFVARVWGAISAARVLRDPPSASGRQAAREHLRELSAGFPCSTQHVLPARLHDAVTRHPDFVPVGAMSAS